MTNGAAIGYMILAAKERNLEHLIIALSNEMISQMDEHTEEEAEEVYRKS